MGTLGARGSPLEGIAHRRRSPAGDSHRLRMCGWLYAQRSAWVEMGMDLCYSLPRKSPREPRVRYRSGQLELSAAIRGFRSNTLTGPILLEYRPARAVDYQGSRCATGYFDSPDHPAECFMPVSPGSPAGGRCVPVAPSCTDSPGECACYKSDPVPTISRRIAARVSSRTACSCNSLAMHGPLSLRSRAYWRRTWDAGPAIWTFTTTRSPRATIALL